MRKIFKITAFAAIIIFVVSLLTSGIKKEFSRSEGSNDLVEELYNRAVKQNNNLGAIEDAIDQFYKKKEDATDKYNSFTSYNNRYYSDARAKANLITDSATKQKALAVIGQSETNYKAKLVDWQTTLATLTTNERTLNDLHNLLKIMITEPVIAKYQTTDLPDNTKAKEANTDLMNVIERIKAITK
jgi:hypothetical protein